MSTKVMNFFSQKVAMKPPSDHMIDGAQMPNLMNTLKFSYIMNSLICRLPQTTRN